MPGFHIKGILQASLWGELEISRIATKKVVKICWKTEPWRISMKRRVSCPVESGNFWIRENVLHGVLNALQFIRDSVILVGRVVWFLSNSACSQRYATREPSLMECLWEFSCNSYSLQHIFRKTNLDINLCLGSTAHWEAAGHAPR